jgi:hypothetical protein
MNTLSTTSWLVYTKLTKKTKQNIHFCGRLRHITTITVTIVLDKICKTLVDNVL